MISPTPAADSKAGIDLKHARPAEQARSSKAVRDVAAAFGITRPTFYRADLLHSPADAKAGIDGWMAFYNETRPHEALQNRTPADVYSGANAPPQMSATITRVDMPTTTRGSLTLTP